MPSDARSSVLIRPAHHPIGIAVPAPDGYRFLAVDPAFALLDGSRFRRLEQVEWAAERLAGAIGDRDLDDAPAPLTSRSRTGASGPRTAPSSLAHRCIPRFREWSGHQTLFIR